MLYIENGWSYNEMDQNLGLAGTPLVYVGTFARLVFKVGPRSFGTFPVFDNLASR